MEDEGWISTEIIIHNISVECPLGYASLKHY